MPLAIFDLDNTLLHGDSDQAWGQFLADLGVVDADTHRHKTEYFYTEYKAGRLDIDEFLEFQLAPLASHPRPQLERWRSRFMAERIMPMIGPEARELVDSHRLRGHRLLIITATNSFITRPIADEFGIDTLIATELELRDGRFTGRVEGTPSFREGKVIKLTAWLQHSRESLADSWFYSDSHNDLPLLERVDHPVAVNPDPVLAAEAQRLGWQVLALGEAGGGVKSRQQG